MRVNRENFLRDLESVIPGLSPKETIEQATCFVFDNGQLVTFNDEIACRIKTDSNFVGAIKAQPLLAILRKLTEEEIELEPGDDQIVIRGKRRSVGVAMEATVLLPIGSLDNPQYWKPLPDDFADAIEIASQCASSDTKEKVMMTCIHLNPKFIEASDNYQVTRYKINTPLEKPVLIRSDSLKQIVPLGMTEFAETESWLHFKNPTGLVLSCRRFADTDDYQEFGELLKVRGEALTLPKGLVEAAEKASIFSSEIVDNNHVTVRLTPGKLRLRGEGVSGWYTESAKIKYAGPSLAFRISPKLLAELTKRHNDCEVTSTMLRVDGGRFVYVACLEDAETSKPEED